MFNVHQICRLCMHEIGLHGTDCMYLRDVREAIKTLYNLEIKSTDECSKRICQPCFHKVAAFMLHHKTVSETQSKIKQFAVMEKAMNKYSNNIKVENEHREENPNGVVIVINDDDDEAIDGDQPTDEQQINSDSSVATTILNDQIIAVNGNSSKPADDASSVNKTAAINNDSVSTTSAAAQQSTKTVPTTVQPEKTATSTALSDQNHDTEVMPNDNGTLEKDCQSVTETTRKNATRKRRLTIASIYDSSLTVPKKSRVEIKNELNGNQSNTLRTSIPSTSQAVDADNTKLLCKTRSKDIHKSKDSTATTNATHKTRVNNDIESYFSNPKCKSCDTSLTTWREQNFHVEFHKNKRCIECGGTESTPNERNIKRHVYSCLLFSGKLTNKDMLKYMRPCFVRMKNNNFTSDEIAEFEKSCLKQRKEKLSNSKRDKRRKSSARAGKNDTKSKNATIKTPNGNNSSEIRLSSDFDLCNDADDDDLNHSGASNQMLKDKHKTAVPIKKSRKSSPKVVKNDDIPLHISINNSIPFRWDQEALKDKLFFVQSFEEMRNTYVDVEPSQTQSKENSSEWCKLDSICTLVDSFKMRFLTGHPSSFRQETNSTAVDFPQVTLSDKANSPPNQQYVQLTVRDRPMSIVHPTTVNSPQVALSEDTDSLSSLQYKQPTARNRSMSIVHPTTVNSPQVALSEDTNSLSSLQYKQPTARNRSMLIVHPTTEVAAVEAKTLTFRRQSTSAANVSNNNKSNQLQLPNSHTTSMTSKRNHINSSVHPQPDLQQLRTTSAQLNPSLSNAPNGQNAPSALPFLENQINPTTSSASNSTVKILTVNELNLRAEQMHIKKVNNGDQRAHNNSEHKATKSPHMIGANDQINVSLRRLHSGQLELMLSCNDTKVNFVDLNREKQIEVQNCLLNGNVWYKMLEHITTEKGTPTKETLELFRKILPPQEWSTFERQYKKSRK